MAEPASGPQRSTPASGTASGKSEKEKRKRSRVTPEQLVHLERFFAMDRSPTAARRKEISTMLGMQERQTQIWFQNRRAKAKLQDGKKGRDNSVETPPDTPPQLVAGYQAELHNLLREDEPITIISCTDLSVGTWRRIATTPGKHDLVAYLSDTKRCLTWFIHASGFGFKMEIPFDIIVNTEFKNAAPGSGLASFFLSQPPTFYLESPLLPNPGRSVEHICHWKKCADWTEDQQATKVLRHNLIGSAVQLAHVLRHLNAYMSASDIRLHSPSYHSQESPPAVLEIQPPPLAAFADAGYHYRPQDGVNLGQSDHLTLAHKRSFSPPIPNQPLSLHDESLHLTINRPHSGVTPERDPPPYPQYSVHPATEVDQSISYPNHSETTLLHQTSHSPLPADCGTFRAFSPHSSHQRSYSTGSLSYEHDGGIPSFPNSLQPLGTSVSTPFETPSPPLLTASFYPAGPAPNACTASPYNPTIPVVSAMPDMSISDAHS